MTIHDHNIRNSQEGGMVEYKNGETVHLKEDQNRVWLEVLGHSIFQIFYYEDETEHPIVLSILGSDKKPTAHEMDARSATAIITGLSRAVSEHIDRIEDQDNLA